MGYETALTGRFGAPDILRAFELLQRQGALLPTGQNTQRHSFRLTDRWRATLQVCLYVHLPLGTDGATVDLAGIWQEAACSGPGLQGCKLFGVTRTPAQALPHDCNAALPVPLRLCPAGSLPCPSLLPQPSGFPPSLFQEAAATANELSQRRRLDFAGREEAEADGEGDGGLAAALATPRAGAAARPAHQAHELSGGAVAALLSGVAAGQVALRTHHVQAEPQLSAEDEIAVGSGSLQGHVAPLLVEVPVRATLAAPRHAVLAAGGSEGSAAGGERGGGTAAAAQAAAAAQGEAADGETGVEVSSQAAAAGEAAGEASGEAPIPAESGGSGGAAPPAAKALSSLKYTKQDLVLFQPALVAVSADARTAAEAACREAVAAGAGIGGAAFDAVLRAVRAAGSAGETRGQLRAVLQGAGGPPDSTGHLLEQLVLHGLARAVCGFEGRRYAAAEHSQCLLAFPHLPLPAAAEPPAAAEQQGKDEEEDEERLVQWRDSFAREVEQLASRLGLPASGQLQPSLDVQVRPWVDHHGRLNTRLWDALVRKALAAAARHPGGWQPAAGRLGVGGTWRLCYQCA